MSMSLNMVEMSGDQVSARKIPSRGETVKAGGGKTPAWDRPVSRKFYEGLMVRVGEVLTAVFSDPSPEYFRNVKRMIDYYLNDDLGALPESQILPEARLIFLSLKAEIDQARERSRRAREASRRRGVARGQKDDGRPRESKTQIVGQVGQVGLVGQVRQVGQVGLVGRSGHGRGAFS